MTTALPDCEEDSEVMNWASHAATAILGARQDVGDLVVRRLKRDARTLFPQDKAMAYARAFARASIKRLAGSRR